MIQVNQYIDFNGKLLCVKRVFAEHNLKPNFDVSIMKEWTRSDVLLRKDGYLYCCETIQDVDFVEIISEE